MSRKIKDIKDRHTGELVYPRTHVSAVVLSSDSTLEDLVDVKQDKIDDLDEIRAGAAKGKTALQSVPSEYVTETELSNKGYATISALNNKVDAINGKQLSTEDFTTALKNKLEGLSNYDDTELSDAIETLRGDFDNIVSGDTTTAIKTFNEVIAFLDGLTDTQDLESIIASIEQQIAGKMDKVTLAKVATSGSYNDLSNKPTIPSAVTESTVSGWGFTKNAGTYSKPSGGIPKSDLASAVQTSLGKADTALQSYTEQYKGTVTGVKINGTTKNPSSGVVDLGTVITAHQDISGKQDKLKVVEISNLTITDLNSEVVINLTDEQNSLLVYDDTVILMSFMFPNATYASRCVLHHSLSSLGKSYTGITIKAFSYDKKGDNIFVKAVRNNITKTLTISFSDIIVTKDSLKTINGESILGDGDITISGGGASGANVQAVDTGDVLDDVAVNYVTKTYVDGLVGNINSILESIING